MKRQTIVTVISALVFTIAAVALQLLIKAGDTAEKQLKVGFVYDGDESTPYTNNFIQAQKTMEKQYKGRVVCVVRNNVTGDQTDEALAELVEEKCNIIFTTSYEQENAAKACAREHPDIQFCQATGDNAGEEPFCDNYHTFMGEIYQGRYVAGLVAGMKLKEMIDSGEITDEQAKIGYVAAYPYPEVISGYTAFLLGARSVAPSAEMIVRYTYTWGSYALEKSCASEMIAEGCVIISQHSDTIGPAVACEENTLSKKVYHVGYNQSMIDIAPTTSLVSVRINWVPYITDAVGALFAGKKIESYVDGNVHGNDIGAGFERDWVRMMELNTIAVAEGTRQKVDETVRGLKEGEIEVFKGDYTGVNPQDEKDTIDLRKGYRENENSSAPKFYYILQDVITIEDDTGN